MLTAAASVSEPDKDDCEEEKYQFTQFTQLRLGQLIQSLNANDSLSDVKSIYEEPRAGARVDAYISGL